MVPRVLSDPAPQEISDPAPQESPMPDATTTQSDTHDWALGIEARCRALLSHSAAADADGHYREAIERLGRATIRVQLARTHLLYGEWLRRNRRSLDAREQLRTAFEMFNAMGIEGVRRPRRARVIGHWRACPQTHRRDPR